jgi:hypothetical protein
MVSKSAVKSVRHEGSSNPSVVTPYATTAEDAGAFLAVVKVISMFVLKLIIYFGELIEREVIDVSSCQRAITQSKSAKRFK